MKIIQVCGLIEGAGITKYMNEMNIGFTQAGHDVKVYEFPTKPDCKLTEKGNFNRKTYLFDYNNEDMINELKTADLVLVHQLMGKRADEEYKEKFMSAMKDLTGPVKVLFFNDHSRTTTGFSRMYGHCLKNKDFLLSFNKYAIHCDCNSFYKAIEKCIGEEEMKKRYVYMHHPHYFDDKHKENWIAPKDKHKRCTYIGRYLTTKHVEQVFELFKKIRNDYEFEIRGIDRLVQYVYIPDLFYDIDKSRRLIRGVDKDMILGPSTVTWSPTKTWKVEHGYDKEDWLIDAPHNNDRIWLFGTYAYQEGMTAMRNSLFGMEFYRLPTANEHGHNLEYCMHEIVEQGTIPIFDAFAMRSIKYFENGKPTDKSLYDMNIGLYLEPDMSNWEEVKRQMDIIANDPKAYEAYRKHAWDVLKEHLNPVATVNEFIKDCMN